MNIRIQVMANQARTAIQQVQGDLTRLSAAQAASNAGMVGGAAGLATMGRQLTKTGSQMQWAGRQIGYNFTLPLAVAGVAATSFALENERAMTRVVKVYGDASMSSSILEKETEALGRAFEALSEKYGVVQSETIAIASEWAAAGSSGLALAKQTDLTMKTMVLGQIDAATATRALIAIQAQYNQSSDELADTIARLNNVENTTGTTMNDLIESMSRAAGVARGAGVDVSHLAAMTAALVPAAGTAAQAGNSLKTIISRIMAPTGDAQKLLREMGFELESMAWKSSDASTRLELIAEKFKNLSDAQKPVVAATLASRYQINKFEVLMRAMTEETSFYYQALEAAGNRTEYLDQVTKELNAVLDSSPKKFDRIKVMLQNSLANAIQEVLPLIIAVGEQIAAWAKSFNNLSPQMQKNIVIGLVLLAVIGPLVSKIGALILLIGMLARFLALLLLPLGLVAKGLWAVLGFMGSAVWGAFMGTMGALSGVLLRVGAVVAGPLAAAWRVGTGAIVAMSSMMWTMMYVAWTAGVRNLGFIMRMGLVGVAAVFNRGFGIVILAAVSAMTRLWMALAAVSLGGGRTLGSVMAGVMALVTRAVAVAAPVMAGTWRLVMLSLSFITVELGAALAKAWHKIVFAIQWAIIVLAKGAGIAWRAMMISLSVIQATMGAALVLAWHKLMFAIQWATIVMAKAMGVAWRAMMVGLAVITAELSAGIAGIWRALMALLVTIQVGGGALLAGAARASMILFQYALIAGAALAGGIWRTLQVTLAAIQVGGAPLLAAAARAGMILFQYTLIAAAAAAGGIWRALQAALVTITLVGSRAIAAAMAAGTVILPRLLALGGAALTGIWTLVWRTLVLITTRGIGWVIAGLRMLGPLLVAAITSPIGLAIAAVAIALYAFRDKLAGIWQDIVGFFHQAVNNVVEAFYGLPKGIQSAIMAVVDIVRTAALQVYEWFSYLNPFARHSPSLVENVANGMEAVRNSFGTITSIKGPIDSAYASIEKFKSTSGALKQTFLAMQRAQEIADMRKAGASPAAIAGYEELARNVAALTSHQNALNRAIESQERVVDGWESRLDAANRALDAQREKLSQLQAVADGYRDRISELSDNMSRLTDTPIKGMQAFDDAIFNNEMAQKRLRLEILKTSQQGGMSFEDLRQKIASINGEIEMLTGERERMRGMGAGSEILGVYDAQIKALEAQKKKLGSSTNSVEKLEAELAKLATQGEILDLEQSLKFDGLTRQIDRAANSMEELPFETILNGVRSNRAQIEQLEKQYDAATEAVKRQEAAVDAAQRTVDAVQASYDAAKDSLDQLKDAYQDVTSAISDMNSAMSDATGAASSINSARDAANRAETLSPSVQAFRDAEGGEFADVGGSGMLSREMPNIEDQSALIDQYTADLQKELAGAFGGFDMWAPFRDMWDAFVRWWNKYVWPWFEAIGTLFSAVFDGVDLGGAVSDMFGDIDFAGILSRAWGIITSVVGTVWDFATMLWDLIGPDIMSIVDNIIEFFSRMGRLVGQVWSDIKERIQPFLEALQNLWDVVLKPFVLFMTVVFAGAIKVAFTLLKNIAEPVLRWLGDMFEAVWQIIKGVLDVFIGIFTGDWKRFWDGIKGIFGGIWNAIVATLRGILGVLWGVIRTVLESIGDLFSWLWRIAIKPIVDAIGRVWNWLGDVIKAGYNNVLKPILNAFGDIFGWIYRNMIKPMIDAIGRIWDWLSGKISSVYNSFIKPIFDAFGRLVTTLKNGFQTGVDAIVRIWETLKNALMTPVRWVVDFVWNNGIRKLWNTINNLWGGNDLAEFRLATGGVIPGSGGSGQGGFFAAKGGVLPGYTPGRDVHHFFSPTFGNLHLSGGEAIMRPEFTRAIGTNGVNYFNQLAASGGAGAVRDAMMGGAWNREGIAYATGGVVKLNDRSTGWASDLLDTFSWILPALPGGGLIDQLNSYVRGERGRAGNHNESMWGQGLGDIMRGGMNPTWHDSVKANTTSHIKEEAEKAEAALIRLGGRFTVDPSGWPARRPGVLSPNTGQAIAAVRARFPQITSIGTVGSRPNASDHPYGKAADFMIPGWDTPAGKQLGYNVAGLLSGMSTQFGLKYLIFDDKISSGDGWGQYTHPLGNTTNATLRHLDHVHASFFDGGGLWRPGSMGINTASGAERVLSPRQTASFERLVTILDGMGSIGGSLDRAIFTAVSRAMAAESAPSTVTYQSSTHNEYHFYGDLSFPNVKDGGDAKTFLDNLSDLAGGHR